MGDEQPKPRAKYTAVAARALSLVELFDARFKNGLPGPVAFKVELSAPDGPSTGGGKQALQHVTLVPQGGGPSIVIGSADSSKEIAEFRTFEHLAALYAQRFKGAPIPIEAARYQELAHALANFFRSMQMNVSFSELDGGVAAPSVRAPVEVQAGSSRLGAILVGLGVGLAVLAVAFWVIFLRR